MQLLQRLDAPKRNIFQIPQPMAVADASEPEADHPQELELEPISGNIETRLIPIASGKGGVGKTNVSVNLSIALADHVMSQRGGGRVILVDCDFGLPNADILLGTHVHTSIDDFIKKKVGNLSDCVTVTGIPGLSFLSGAETPSMTLSNLQYQHRQKFLRHLKALEAQYVVLDLGASVHYEVVDFFSMVNVGVVVTNPEPTAMRDSYLFIRAVIHRKIRQEAKDWPVIVEYMDRLEGGTLEIPSIPGILDDLKNRALHFELKALRAILEAFQPRLVINRAETFEEGVESARKMQNEARRELGIEIQYLGPVIDDPCVVRAVKESAPFIRRFPESDASHWIRNLAQRIIENEDFEMERNYFSFGSYIKRLFNTGRSA